MKKAKHCDCHKAKPAEWSIKNALTDPGFFDRHDAGDIAFKTYKTGKSVYGFCKYIPLDERCRDAQAQLESGGDHRMPHDHGGHLLSVAVGGCSDTENLVPMEGKLNQGEYKSLELDLISKLKAGDDLYVEISSFNNETKSQRPDFFTYNWVSRDAEGNLDYGFETFLNEYPEAIETEEIDPAEFDEVMERAIKEIPPLGPEALEALAAEFDDME